MYPLTIHAFFPIIILPQARFRRALEGFAFIAICGGSLLGFRIYFMGNKPPEFAPSDNPASDSDSLLTRVLTYNFLPAANFWMILCPRVLSFDWSMEAVPLLESLSDVRNLATAGFYSSLLFLVYKVFRTLEEYESHSDENGQHYSGIYNGFSAATNGVSGSPTKLSGKNGVHIPHTSLNNNHPSSSQKAQSNGHHNGKTVSALTNGHERTFSSLSSTIIPTSFRPVDVVMLSVAIIVFPFIPASNMFFYVGFVLAERVLYMPSMGVCLLVGLGVHTLYNKYFTQNAARRELVLAGLVLLIAAFSAKTVIRNRDWQTEERLYRAGVAVNPAKGGYAKSFFITGKILTNS